VKKILLLLTILFLGSVFLCAPVVAVPLLQLDISGGTYDPYSQTIVTKSDSFTLYALLANKPTSDGNFTSELLDENFYISVALMPRFPKELNPDPDLGSFTFDGQRIKVTADMIYGGPTKLPPHGIFSTYYQQLGPFQFDNLKYTAEYDTQDNPGGLAPTLVDPSKDKIVYYLDFDVDTSGLVGNYDIHFDLYHYDDLGNVNLFAPFSHDAQTVPEPATMLLLGFGLVGLTVFGRKRFLKGA
jgi:hypothetical protein